MRADGPPLRIERRFAADPERVYDAWTSIDALRRWWPAGPGWTTPVAELDVRVGGLLRLVMRDTEGAEFGGEGSFLTLDRPHRLAFTWRWDDPALGAAPQVVEVTFTGNADGTTTVVLTNTGLTEAEAEEHRDGWELSFVNLDALLDDATEHA
jgi:uncharacterized protein YndB with AHSA1/START domain